MTTLPIPFSGVEPAIDAIGADATVEMIAEADQRLTYLIGFAQAMKRKFEEALIEHIKVNGPVKYRINAEGAEKIFSLGHSKSVKCKDVKQTVEHLVRYAEGDWDKFVTCLSSGAIKYGEARKILPDRFYKECFETVTKDKLVDGSPAPKELQVIDTRWIR